MHSTVKHAPAAPAARPTARAFCHWAGERRHSSSNAFEQARRTPAPGVPRGP
ncbi:hypothetical protein PCLA_02r0231 [Pseudomonas citronellolis]|nr:hypothetical protein PCLA_02r0231 [Pseudomonas citronellolis]